MGKKSTPPPAPDYKAAAEATANSNQAAQTRADYTNRPTINTPWGTESWKTSSAIDPSTGQPVTQWAQNTTLNPQSQRALDSQMALETGRSDLAGGMMGRVENDFAKPFDWSAMPARADTPQSGAFGGDVSSHVGDASRQRVEQGLLERLRPEQARASDALETQMANKGLTPGSAAYERERQRLSDSQSRQQFDALMSGGQEQMNQFNMALNAGQYENAREGQRFDQGMRGANFQNQNRQAATAEQMAQRNMSLNEMNALLSGQQIGMPDMPDFNTSQSAGGTNYT